MVHALREEPGSCARTLEDGTEVIYRICPSDGGFAAGWERTIGGDPADSHEEEFSSHADTLRYFEENFDAPLGRAQRHRGRVLSARGFRGRASGGSARSV